VKDAKTLKPYYRAGLVYGSSLMNSWTEGALAVVVILGLGLGLFLFTGESIGDGGGGSDATPPLTVDPEAAARGAILAEGQGCLECHTTDGTLTSSPSWKGLAGSTRPLSNGNEVVADDSYLFASIVDPSSQIVEGYDQIMPEIYSDQLDEQQITDLVEYIKSLAA
jgi:mono/diheme cytochrome c family protein